MPCVMQVPQLHAATTAIEDPGDLRDLLPPQWRTAADDPAPHDPRDPRDSSGPAAAAAWFHRDEGIVGLGEVARCEMAAVTDAEEWWLAVAEGLRAHSTDPDHGTAPSAAPGSGVGPLAFGSFVFDAHHTQHLSVLVVPRLIIGSRDGQHWMTRIARVGEPLPEPVLPPRTPSPASPGVVSWSDGAVSGPEWEGIVAEAVARIRGTSTPQEDMAGGDMGAGPRAQDAAQSPRAQGAARGPRVQKVVLARELVATGERAISPRWLIEQLAPAYPRCWTFWVDDMVGATPEMLVRLDQGLATSRVLAGTIWRGAQGPKRRPGGERGPGAAEHSTSETISSSAIAEVLAQSEKNLGEHAFAVDSVAHALEPFCTGMNVPDSPFVLELPNVMHLATDVNAVVRPGTTSLALAAALHPSAAVCGTPTPEARHTIAAIEGLDRGRYSGPIGWIDTQGNGEWGIALRCGRLQGDGRSMALFAGCGIVADSDPAVELAESNAKLVPMRDALESRA